MNNKSEIQEAQYRFPYHYTPHIDDHGFVRRFRSLRWGFEYLCYMLHIRNLIMEKAPESLLDAGCGDGRLLSLLCDSKNTNLTGIDISERAVGLAQALNPKVRCLCGNVSDLSETFAMVTIIEVLEHIADDQLGDFIDAVAAKVRPGGQLLVCVPTNNKPWSEKHYRQYDESLLLKQLAPEKRGLIHESSEYIFNGKDPLYSFYTRITDNRFWFVGIELFERFIWRRVWQKLRFTTHQKGFHLLMSLRKAA